MERLANHPVSTLTTSINSSATTLDVDDPTVFPGSENFTIKIGVELMRVTGVSGPTFTVIRGHEGTTAASHTAGAVVAMVVTDNVMQQLLAELYQTGISANRPTLVRAGTIYQATDVNLSWRYNGTNWDLIKPCYIPYARRINVSGWTDINTTGLTWNDYNGVAINTIAGASGQNIRGKYHTIPTAPFSATLIVGHPPMTQANWQIGIFLHETATSEIKTYMVHGTDNWIRMGVQDWTSSTAFSAELTNNAQMIQNAQWIVVRLTDDNTNWKFEFSYDMQYWTLVHTQARNSFLTPDVIGLGVHKGTTYYSTNPMPFSFLGYWEA